MAFFFNNDIFMKGFSFLLMIVLCNISCRQTYYIPNSVNVPMLEEKGDFEVKISNQDRSGPGIQLAYALKDDLGLMFNARWENKKYESYSGLTSSGKNYLAEGAIGIFNSSENNLIKYSLYGGLGYFNYKGKYGYTSNFSRLHALKSFVQVNFMSLDLKYIDFSIFSRFSNLYYFDVHYSITEDEFINDLIYLESVDKKSITWFIEPGIQLGIGK